jgi:hypothetical protein
MYIHGKTSKNVYRKIQDNDLLYKSPIASVSSTVQLTQEAQQLRERMGKWDYMKLKSLCTTKEMVSKLKRSPTE